MNIREQNASDLAQATLPAGEQEIPNIKPR
jgi:hypothetical protein